MVLRREHINSLVPITIAFSWNQMHHGMLHEHGKAWNFAGHNEVCYCLVLSNHHNRIQFRNIYFQVFVWTNYSAYRKESNFACWVLKKKSFYVSKIFNYLFDRIIIRIQCHNRLFFRNVHHELDVQKVWCLHLYNEIFHCWMIVESSFDKTPKIRDSVLLNSFESFLFTLPSISSETWEM